ncbi:MAG: MaoC family dehydratase [Dehalococcoidales bacterium]|jgi:acyl dehydratase|nr:MaoC family dehydratase [Dehalococcoidales bacterium]MDP7285665.1 MaoC family dehydratase [Dehalococcoidales bacterium]MDP7416012.1 MaoC family dehydratase [Dehalococcoidales bacterium]|tara:strand:+ start:197 stop:616 length:420 start_codon:yes stop_codon:yes gene_type:complete
MINLSQLKEGMDLPEIKKVVRQENINRYAEVSRDFNPIHIDADYARQTPLGGTVAHGMLILAYISQMMTAAFEESWVSDGKLSVRFKAPARPGDTITASGKVRRVEKSEDRNLVNCEVLCKNQNDEAVITGEAVVRVKG